MKPIAILKQKFVDASLKIKLMIFFIGLIVLSSMIFYVIVYAAVSSNSRQQIERTADLSFSQAHDFIQKKIWPLLYSADLISNSHDIQSILTSNTKIQYDNVDLAQQYRDMLKLRNIISSAENTNEILQIRLYVHGPTMYSSQDVWLSDLTKIKDLLNNWPPQQQYRWLPPEDVVLYPNEEPVRVVSLLRKIRNLDDYMQVIGTVKVCLSADDLNAIIFKSNITDQGAAFIVNSNGRIICASDGDEQRNITLAKLTQDKVSDNWKSLKLANNYFLIKSQPIEKTDWRMIALIPINEIHAQGRRIGYLMLSVIAGVIVVASIPAWLFSDWFVRRLRLLIKNMIRVRMGDLDINIGSTDMDEVGMLYESFDFMVSELKEFSRRQYENGKAMKTAELRVLQAQINPHFLYNSLDLINWEALNHGVPEIAEIARSLARFYRIGLKKGLDIVTIQDEIEHIRAYIDIQNYRFENRIKLIVNVPEELTACLILKITLQPLVENAIAHGLAKQIKTKIGMIAVGARIANEIIEITVEDNGVGMAADRISSIFTSNDRTEGGYGLHSVDTRIKLYYGQEYGITFDSLIGLGTTAIIRIPAKFSLESPD